MHRIATVTVLAALAALSLAPTVAAQSRGRRQAPARRATAPKGRVAVEFTTSDRDLIVKYFRGHPYKARPLPPGIAKNLARGKPLPPGLAKRRLPSALVTQLPRRSGVTVNIVGDRLVLLNDRGLVVDIMVNVF